MILNLEAQLTHNGLDESASHVFQVMADHIERWPGGDEGFKGRLTGLPSDRSWNANDSYVGMHPPQHLAEDEFKPVESYDYFEVYIVFEAQIKVPFAQFVDHMKTTAAYYLQSHPAEKAEVQKRMADFEAHVAALQKAHDRWLRDAAKN